MSDQPQEPTSSGKKLDKKALEKKFAGTIPNFLAAIKQNRTEHGVAPSPKKPSKKSTGQAPSSTTGKLLKLIPKEQSIEPPKQPELAFDPIDKERNQQTGDLPQTQEPKKHTNAPTKSHTALTLESIQQAIVQCNQQQHWGQVIKLAQLAQRIDEDKQETDTCADKLNNRLKTLYTQLTPEIINTNPESLKEISTEVQQIKEQLENNSVKHVKTLVNVSQSIKAILNVLETDMDDQQTYKK